LSLLKAAYFHAPSPSPQSVAAYSDHADDYEAAHATKMLDTAERFAGSLPAPSLILDAGCGPGHDLARFSAEQPPPRLGLFLCVRWVALPLRPAPRR
jgi:SAM-dependent methyltransferase